MIYVYGLITYVVMAFVLLLVLSMVSLIFLSHKSLYKPPFFESMLSYIINGNVTYQTMLYFSENPNNVNTLYFFIPVLIISLFMNFIHYLEFQSIYRLGSLHGAITGVVLLTIQYLVWA